MFVMFATFSKCVGKRYFCGWQYSVTSSISICAIPAPRKGFSSTLKRERWVTACSCQYKWWERKTTVPEKECDVTMFFGDGCCVVRGEDEESQHEVQSKHKCRSQNKLCAGPHQNMSHTTQSFRWFSVPLVQTPCPTAPCLHTRSTTHTHSSTPNILCLFMFMKLLTQLS